MTYNPLQSSRNTGRARIAAAILAVLCPFLAVAQEMKAPDSPPAAAEAKDRDKTDEESPLPADARVAETVQLGGKTLPYTATVGTLPVYNNGKKTGEVVYTAYTVEGRNRPVTFALNGGPGASSVFLNLGAIGPKHIEFGRDGDSPSDPATLNDNPGTWLDFTDLVFVDPIGTGFSRSLTSPEETINCPPAPSAGTRSPAKRTCRIVQFFLIHEGLKDRE
jgi:carboxypeptidase C (cathepsin A)